MNWNKFIVRDVIHRVAICTFSNKTEQHLAIPRVTYCYLDFYNGPGTRPLFAIRNERMNIILASPPPIDCNFLNEWTHAQRMTMCWVWWWKQIFIDFSNQLFEIIKYESIFVVHFFYVFFFFDEILLYK